jgi:hypothetical protein
MLLKRLRCAVLCDVVCCASDGLPSCELDEPYDDALPLE